MGFATPYINDLKNGNTVKIKVFGNSMKGLIKSGSTVEIEPIDTSLLKTNDIVLCRVRGCDYLHIIKGIKKDMFLIGNNIGGINGWTNKRNIYGRLRQVL